jgi:hypothetical protein
MVAGNDAELAAAKQSAKGTPATTATARIYLADGTVMAVPTQADLEQTSAGRVRSRSYRGGIRVEGSPTFYAVPDALGLFLFGAFGAQAISGAADPYTHTFTLANTQVYMTFWRRLATLLYESFADCKIGRLRLESQAGQPMRCIIDVLGLDPRSRDSAAYTTAMGAVIIEDTDPFYHYDGAGALLVEGVAATEIATINLEIQNNLVWQQGDNVTGFAVEEGMRAITLEVGHVVVNAALYNRYHYGTAAPATGTAATKGVVELAASGVDFLWTRQASPERSLRVTMTRLQIENLGGFVPNVSGEPLMQTVNYRAFQPSGGVSAVTAILKNAKAVIY